MKIGSIGIVCALCLGLSAQAGTSVDRMILPVIPEPMEYTVDSGYFYFTPATTFGVENESQLQLASRFVALLGHTAGFLPGVEVGAPEADVQFTTVASMADEAYRLSVTTGHVAIEASGDAGFFYALQTLRQLLPSVIEGGEPIARNLCRIPGTHARRVALFYPQVRCTENHRSGFDIENQQTASAFGRRQRVAYRD